MKVIFARALLGKQVFVHWQPVLQRPLLVARRRLLICLIFLLLNS